jgi:hypothetical protein
MTGALKIRPGKVLRTAIALSPWVISMYLFFWLDSSGTWTSETPHRGKLSVAILATGMLLSFLVQSWFAKRKPN